MAHKYWGPLSIPVGCHCHLLYPHLAQRKSKLTFYTFQSEGLLLKDLDCQREEKRACKDDLCSWMKEKRQIAKVGLNAARPVGSHSSVILCLQR